MKLTDGQILEMWHYRDGIIEFARAIAAEQRKIDAELCRNHPGHTPSNKWNASAALGSCEEAILKEG